MSKNHQNFRKTTKIFEKSQSTNILPKFHPRNEYYPPPQTGNLKNIYLCTTSGSLKKYIKLYSSLALAGRYKPSFLYDSGTAMVPGLMKLKNSTLAPVCWYGYRRGSQLPLFVWYLVTNLLNNPINKNK